MTAKRNKAASAQLIHEQNKEGQHRLVILKPGKAPDNSAWFEYRETGHYKGYLFQLPQGNSPLKPGVFRQSMLKSESLGAVRFEQPIPLSRGQLASRLERSDG